MSYELGCHLISNVNSLFVTQVSQAAADLQQYCLQNASKDALLVGVPAGSNPFREPRSCTLL
ncbi:guanine nucleotide-binding protein G(I)/G(S)/G(O) subunit gamma-10-like [Ctenopharyngodon idella]|uniref:guanine nucleotide-binding protein G(I)/G(S)/G(O) subunit gamma-10-like n=1 Tax=Ctenopharyngodon idella TaxID=7959 RepID=UPI00222E784F|nr:guanine nucleotide-binding protein G(I)/G(S)/G(O) subunit gamma-10-like [Ctenopharyngodon idella]